MPVKMFCKDANAIVTVYAFDLVNKIALVYNPWLAEKQNGNGWVYVAIRKLRPIGIEKETLPNEFKEGVKNA